MGLFDCIRSSNAVGYGTEQDDFQAVMIRQRGQE